MLPTTAPAWIALFVASAAASWGYDATGVGSAHVVNKCSYPVKLCNVPSSGGGYEEQDTILAAGESWEQVWTSLSNGNGWSIKLSKPDNPDHILQYEYTFHDDGVIWYDLSCVDGNPWDKDWEITAKGTDCAPKQQAYRYSTDDAYGMQSCSQDTVITVTLCTGISANNDTSGTTVPSNDTQPAPVVPVVPSVPNTPSAPPAPSYPSASSSSSTTPTPTPYEPPESASSAPQVTPTPYTAPTEEGGIVIITEWETIFTTAEVTAYANRYRRHEHGHGGHQHHA